MIGQRAFECQPRGQQGPIEYAAVKSRKIRAANDAGRDPRRQMSPIAIVEEAMIAHGPRRIASQPSEPCSLHSEQLGIAIRSVKRVRMQPELDAAPTRKLRK